MNFFKSSRDGSSYKDNDQSSISWYPITSYEQLDKIVESSRQKTALIFKHSTRCGISRMVLKRFENELGQQENVDAYFLDLLLYREISNEIARRFGVTHQSPQMIIIKDGVSVYDASHESIDAAVLKNFA